MSVVCKQQLVVRRSRVAADPNGHITRFAISHAIGIITGHEQPVLEFKNRQIWRLKCELIFIFCLIWIFIKWFNRTSLSSSPNLVIFHRQMGRPEVEIHHLSRNPRTTYAKSVCLSDYISWFMWYQYLKVFNIFSVLVGLLLAVTWLDETWKLRHTRVQVQMQDFVNKLVSLPNLTSLTKWLVVWRHQSIT